MDNILIVVIESETEFKLILKNEVTDVKTDEIEETLKNFSRKFKEIHIFISDLFVFSITDNLQVKKKSDAVKAAEYQLTTILHSNKIKNYLHTVSVEKFDDGFKTVSYYTETDFNDIIGNLEKILNKKIIRISPLFELFKDKYSAYKYEDRYITLIEDNKNSTFPVGKIPSTINTDNLKHIKTENIKEFFKKKPDIDFKNKNILVNFEKYFVPALALIIALNVFIYAYAKMNLNTAEKEYKEELAKVKKMEIQLKPFRDLSAKKESYISYINMSKKIRSNKNFIEKTVYDLAKDFPDIWLKSLYYRNGKMNLSISYKKTQKIVDYLESKKYISSAIIKGRVTRNGELENSTIEVIFAN